MLNYKEKIFKLFEANPNKAYELCDLTKELSAEPKHISRDLGHLVRSKLITKAWPGLCGGRKCTYMKLINRNENAS